MNVLDMPVIDMNVSLGHWPFEPMRPQSGRQLKRHLENQGIVRAVVSSLDSVLYREPQWGNEALYRSAARYEGLFPCCVVNPSLPNWESVLMAGIEAGCRMVKLYPNYHQYELSHVAVDELVSSCERESLLIALSIRVEDERAHPAIMKVPATSIEGILGLAERWSERIFLVLCPTLAEVQRLAEKPNLVFEISHVEHLNSLATLFETVPSRRIVFGSHTPFLYTGAALAKLSDPAVSDADRRQVAFEVANRLLQMPGGHAML